MYLAVSSSRGRRPFCEFGTIMENTRVIGIVTIGQTPRPDLVRAFEAHAPGARVEVLGALERIQSEFKASGKQVSMADLIADVGPEEAGLAYRQFGRQAFLPVRTLHRILRQVAPDLVERLPLLNDLLALDFPETVLVASLDTQLRHESLVALLLIPGVPRWVPVVAAVVALAVFVWAWWLIGRRCRSWGYAERDDDLLVTRGILFRRLVVVPYGRMQLVDLKAGPIDRWLGVATLQLHTAAATTDASIPGLPPEVAAGLRDRLAALGEKRSAGL